MGYRVRSELMSPARWHSFKELVFNVGIETINKAISKDGLEEYEMHELAPFQMHRAYFCSFFVADFPEEEILEDCFAFSVYMYSEFVLYSKKIEMLKRFSDNLVDPKNYKLLEFAKYYFEKNDIDLNVYCQPELYETKHLTLPWVFSARVESTEESMHYLAEALREGTNSLACFKSISESKVPLKDYYQCVVDAVSEGWGCTVEHSIGLDLFAERIAIDMFFPLSTLNKKNTTVESVIKLTLADKENLFMKDIVNQMYSFGRRSIYEGWEMQYLNNNRYKLYTLSNFPKNILREHFVSKSSYEQNRLLRDEKYLNLLAASNMMKELGITPERLSEAYCTDGIVF